MQAASAWSLGQIGRHTSDHARALAEGDVLRHLLACMVHQDSSEDLKIKSKRALKAILAKCTHLQALQPLLHGLHAIGAGEHQPVKAVQVLEGVI